MSLTATPPNVALKQFEAAQDLERFLGNPEDNNSFFSFEKIMALDEAEAYPEDLINAINTWGLHLYYIPEAYGGKLKSIEEMFAITRALSRRDLTSTIAHGGTFLGAISIWLAGSEPLKEEVATMVRAHKKIALSLTEFNHGSDLNNNQVIATKTDANTYTLNGEKWLFNHALRGNAITMLVRTKTENTPRSHSLLFLKKDELDATAYNNLDKIKTHGVRGLDMGGFAMDNLKVDAQRILKKEGVGLEVIIKTLQVTRTMCAAFSLGAADTCLRTVVKFGIERKLYGDVLINMPAFRQKLVASYTTILANEALSTVATRALHQCPRQFSVMSAIVKSTVPEYAETAIQNLSTLLGARYYLRDEYNHGIFQKMLRDSATVSLFDGNTAVNHHAILLQLPLLLKSKTKEWEKRSTDIQDNLKAIYNLETPLAPLQLEELRVIAKGKDDLAFGLELGIQQLQTYSDVHVENSELIQTILKTASQTLDYQKTLEHNVTTSDIQLGNVYQIPAVYYDYAKAYSLLHMASACINIWLHNQDVINDALQKPTWLLASLFFINKELGLATPTLPEPLEIELLQALIANYESNQMFSLFKMHLAS